MFIYSGIACNSEFQNLVSYSLDVASTFFDLLELFKGTTLILSGILLPIKSSVTSAVFYASFFNCFVAATPTFVTVSMCFLYQLKTNVRFTLLPISGV